MANPFAQFAWIATVIIADCLAINLYRTGAFNRGLGAVLVLWLLYSCYETFYIDFPRINIRVDLLLIFPILAITTIVGLVRWVKG